MGIAAPAYAQEQHEKQRQQEDKPVQQLEKQGQHGHRRFRITTNVPVLWVNNSSNQDMFALTAANGSDQLKIQNKANYLEAPCTFGKASSPSRLDVVNFDQSSSHFQLILITREL